MKEWQQQFVKFFFVYKLGGKHPDHVGAEKDALAFIETLLSQETEKARKEEESRWLNQTANEHDQRIREHERSICRQIFIDEVDWAEWGMSDEDAGERFDEERTKLK